MQADHARQAGLGLGIDAGGTQTRWALAAPGGCVQVIINSHTAAGNLFDYGFFPIEPKYCP